MSQRLYFLVALACLGASALAQEQGIGDPTFPSLGNKGYLATHYSLKLRYDPAKDFLEADVTMMAKATSALNKFSVDFTGFKVSSVLLNNRSADYARSENKLTVTLGNPIKTGTEFTLETVYSGKPAQASSVALEGLKVGWVSYPGGAVALCEPDLAHTWFPCNDHPRNKATFEFDIQVPDGYKAIANGRSVDEAFGVGRSGLGTATGSTAARTGSGSHTFRWVMDKPIATYAATVAIGKYDSFEQPGLPGMNIINYVPAGKSESFRHALLVDTAYIKLLSEKLGLYPFESYGVVELPAAVGETNGLVPVAALETTTIPVFGNMVGDQPDVLIHEMAHQWMGNCVSITNWGDDIWWVEGFAHYSEWLRVEALGNKADYEQAASETYKAFSKGKKWLAPGHLSASKLFADASYEGGALVFYALRRELGDSFFFKTVRTFVDRKRDGNASAKDWIKAATDVSGRDMNAFFNEWLYGEKLPTLKP